ncbi:MAG: L-2-hydroxyglutarate oxidase [Nitrospira sp.]|nr:L-2-hydroxyglutarate oxidase [Nitrospira sp.]
MEFTDFLVIGGGVIGLNVARSLKRMFPDTRVIVIEKEASCGLHASGRNSGVLHAGFYYSPDSLKAKFTRDGNAQLTAYCREKGIPLNRCGKLVVAKDVTELPALDELLKRGKANDIKLEELSEQDARKIEPRAKTYQRALFSPTTSTVNPNTVLQTMVADAIVDGVEIKRGVAFVGKTGRTVQTTECQYEAGYVVNAAGLYADQIARQFGFSERYRILPFKGLYLYSDEPPGALRTNIYPVPDLRNPFLGVHFTVTNEGKAKIGPTAIPAMWREQYAGISRFSLAEFIEIAGRGLSLLGNAGFEFRRLAIEEVKKYSRRRMVRLAGELVEGVRLEHYSKWGKPGIRAQLLDIKKRRLEMDFVLEGDDRSMHILNAVSPAFTCSLPFSQYVCDRIEQAVR